MRTSGKTAEVLWRKEASVTKGVFDWLWMLEYRKLASVAHNGQMSGFLIHQDFSEFGGFAQAAKGWNLEFLQMERGTFNASLTHLLTPGVVLSKVVLGRKMLQQGETPPGFRTFAYASGQDLDLKWRGKNLGSDQLMIFPPGEGLESVSMPGFDVFVLSVSEWLLDQFAEGKGLDSVDQLFPSDDLISLDAQKRRELRVLSEQLLSAGIADPSLVFDWSYREQLERQLVSFLLKCVEGAVVESRHRTMSKARRLAVVRAVDVMRARAADPITLSEVENLADVSARTLRYAFQDFYGIPPKAYLNCLRLNRVRAELLRGQSGLRVKDAARRWGFWHMGQFSGDYFRQFGERPSETLAASKVC